MALVIKKPVNLSSLGDEYKDINLVFRSIPAKDLGELNTKQESFDKDEEGNFKDLSQVLPFFIEILQKYYIEGKQGSEQVTKEDLGDADSSVLIHCFQILAGQKLDPKEQNSSTKPSSTTNQDQ